MLLLCEGDPSRNHGHNLILSLRANHKEKNPSLGNDLTALLCSDQRDGGRRGYLWYPIQLITQINNHKAKSRLIYNMSLP